MSPLGHRPGHADAPPYSHQPRCLPPSLGAPETGGDEHAAKRLDRKHHVCDDPPAVLAPRRVENNQGLDPCDCRLGAGRRGFARLALALAIRVPCLGRIDVAQADADAAGRDAQRARIAATQRSRRRERRLKQVSRKRWTRWRSPSESAIFPARSQAAKRPSALSYIIPFAYPLRSWQRHPIISGGALNPDSVPDPVSSTPYFEVGPIRVSKSRLQLAHWKISPAGFASVSPHCPQDGQKTVSRLDCAHYVCAI